MDKKKERLIQVAVICILIITLFSSAGQVTFSSWESGEYSPMPEAIDDLINPDRDPVQVSGRVVYDVNETPVVGLEVRLFAADELTVEYVTTDFEGYFYSSNYYETGQIIKVTYGEYLYLPNIPYNQDEIYFLGTFLMAG